MERILLPIVIGGGVIVLAGFLIWLFLHLEKKRTAALLAIAEELGLHFSATHSEDLSARMQKFPLFNKGRGRKIRNVMQVGNMNSKDKRRQGKNFSVCLRKKSENNFF